MTRTALHSATLVIIACLASSAMSLTAFAKEPDPAFMQHVYLPELVMRHASDIGLTKKQRRAVTEAVKETQGQTLELGWDMQEAARELGKLMSQTRVDREATLAAAKRVMEIEVQVKYAHMGLLIAIKNALEPEQQKQLRALRD